MDHNLSPEDLELDARWRKRFGQPLPILGARELVEIMLATPVTETERQISGNVIRGPWPSASIGSA